MMDMMHECAPMLLWGFIATCAMACIQEGSQAFGLSRMSFPFLVGTFFCGNRRRANAIGFFCYLSGGWAFTAMYDYLFGFVGGTVRIGALTGFCQGMIMLLVVMPLLPSIHPRMASPYDGPEASRRIEPPGFFALNYGARAPVFHLVGQTVFGLILGATYSLR